ncbi:aldo/keto reductase [Tessaracoccus rhinocerotis]|uniref:Aldo/keto reductase n=1 Tax=Tessaracoccus rhinocerotis TaxID=1689449 RepID=A0A553K697_9ACTN|nr:aldo/keto reductase [Tessaracoccus rhinocerotis]TRY20226.1 aldo/keto reductase [Tessaracoccus rhinocerotis]
MTNLAPTIPLSGGAAIPAIGAGTWPLDDAEVEAMALTAFELGYRLIDTAENYRNEAGVGKAVRNSGLPREDLFVTTKFNRKWHGDAVGGVENNLATLGLDYVDLVLIHWPNPDQDLYVRAWEGLVEARERGLVRAIGTSNFKPSHLQRIIDATGVTPDVNQIQCNPFTERAAERAFHAEHGIVTESWAPLAAGNGLIDDPMVAELAEEHVATPAQVVLAWHVSQGLVPIPKSSNRERLEQNLAAASIRLGEMELQRLSDLTNPDYRAADSDSFGH